MLYGRVGRDPHASDLTVAADQARYDQQSATTDRRACGRQSVRPARLDCGGAPFLDELDEYLWVSRAGFAKKVDGHDCDRGRRNVATRSAAVSLSPVQLVRPDEERADALASSMHCLLVR